MICGWLYKRKMEGKLERAEKKRGKPKMKRSANIIPNVVNAGIT